jgi:molecular chaperone GrpE (heat shock protein)
MSQFSTETNRQLLQNLMQKVNISDLEELSAIAAVPRLQLLRIQRGLILNLSVRTIAKIAAALQISVDRLIETFVSPTKTEKVDRPEASSEDRTIESLKEEYQRLQQQITRQQESLQEEFQQASIHTIESWLLQWPTAVAAVHKNPQLPAARLLTLVKPIEQLIQDWNIEQIAVVGEKLAFDPQWHQLIKGTAKPGEIVEVRYVGYKQEDKLLYKAKVSPVEVHERSQ